MGGKSGLKRLDRRALRAIVLLAILFLGAYSAFFRLGVEDWQSDVLTYRDAGLEYVQDGEFSSNQEHPFLVKYILGVTQIVAGSSEPEVVRIPAATATLLTGLVLFAFAQRVAGYWSGVLALALWTISPLTLRIGRDATLEPFFAFFATLALYLGWRWAESSSWRFAAFAGFALGLATASKLVGILFLPAILLVGLLKMGLSRRLVFQSMLVGLAIASTVLATYAPLGGEAPSAIRYMVDFQSAHNARGHPTIVNGEVWRFPPWWTHLWRQWELYGTLASLSLGVAVVVGLLRRRVLELYLLVAALVPFLFLSFYVQVKLGRYFFTWQPPLILLLAVAAGTVAQWRITGRLLAVLLLVPFAYLGLEALRDVSQVKPGPKATVAQYLKDTGHDRGPILVQAEMMEEYLPEEAWILREPEDAQGEEIETVIVQQSVARRYPDPSIENYLADSREDFESSNPVGDLKVYTRKPDR